MKRAFRNWMPCWKRKERRDERGMHMEYRMLPHGGERISVIGLGTSSLGEADEQEIIETVRMALDHGINYIDMACGHAATFSGVGKAIAERRDQVYLQIHFGADYTSGEYGWTTDPKRSRQPLPGSWISCRTTISISASSTASMRKAICAPCRKTASSTPSWS